jgi:hypothetical protein
MFKAGNEGNKPPPFFKEGEGYQLLSPDESGRVVA